MPLLRAHDERLLGAPMPVGAKNRIAARLAERARSQAEPTARRWLPMVAFAAGAALVLAVVGLEVFRGTSTAASTPTSAPSATLAGYAVSGNDCRARRDGESAVLAGECRLVGEAMTVQTWDAVRLLPRARSVQVQDGQAMFDVQTVERGDTPVRVVVSHGVIEVLGTRFTVDQGPGGGTVDLFEGHIRFVPTDRAESSVDIEPGQRYAWGDRVVAHAAVEPPAGDDPSDAEIIVTDESPKTSVVREAVARRGTAAEATALIERVAALRAAGRYQRAASTLRRALRRSWDARTAQVLSYELGQILDRHLNDTVAACRHWRRHNERYPEGRYAGAVAKTLRECP